MKKNKKPEQRRARRLISDEFRADVVKLCQSEGESLPDVCKRLGLKESTVRGCVNKTEEAAQGGNASNALTSSEKQELQRLRRENKRLKMERDILKKAATFFAKENT